MSKKTPFIFLLHLLALILGSSFTMIPSSSGFLLSEKGMNLSKLDYGNVFILLISGALFTSYFAGVIAKNIGVKNLLIFGLSMSCISMGLFSLESLFLHQVGLSYPTLILVLFFLGMGYGAMMTSLSTYFLIVKQGSIENLFKVFAMGACISPLLFMICQPLGIWWVAPLLLATSLGILTILVFILFPKPDKTTPTAAFSLKCLTKKKGILLIASITVIYGACETLFTNWGIVFLTQDKGECASFASYCLFLFWFFIMLGRFIGATIPKKKIIIGFPLILTIGFIGVALSSSSNLILITSSLAGLGCSALLPLFYKFSQNLFKKEEIAICGMLAGMYIIGYSLAAAGVASVEKRGEVSFTALFIGGGIIVLIAYAIGLGYYRKWLKSIS